jgi:hypothetical protein
MDTSQKPLLHAAFVKAYAEVQNVAKNANNPHFGSDYATLDAVIDTVKPVFAKHGLAVYQAPGRISLVGDALVVSVVSSLMHESGEAISIETQVPLGGKATAQAAGGAITYARRYALAAIAGIAQVDDDGNSASSGPSKKAAGVIAKIAACEDKDDLEALRPEVLESQDQAAVEAFTAKRKALSKGKK